MKPKVLHLFSVKSNLGDAIRINEMRKYLSKHSQYDHLNFANSLGSKLNLKNLFIYLRGLLGGKSLPIIKEQIYLNRCIEATKNKLRSKNFDSIVAELAHNGYVGIKAARGYNIKIITDVHGIASQEYAENKYQRKIKDYSRLIEDLDRFIFTKSDVLICVSQNMKRFAIEKYGDQGNFFIAPNGTQVSDYKAKFSKPLKLIYGGIFAFWEDLDTFLDLARYDKKNKYFLMGDGPEKKRIMRRIKKEKIPIRYLGSKKREEAHRIFAKMNVGVAPTTTGVTRQVASPIKVYDYMSLGLPVITARCGDWGEDIKKYDAGFVCQKSDAKMFLEAVRQLENQNIWSLKSSNAIKLSKSRDWQNIFENSLKKIFQGS
ncbi:MAG: glycosyltransferase [Candidatus Berkelbacteria bacterium]|nr:glycosyltransferase [Candidatus Berkelbacteria bacterium]